MRATVLAVVLAAGPASAGCFTADEMPEKAIYGTASVLEYLGRDGDVLTYRSGELTSRVKDGVWPLDHRSETFNVDYQWDDPLPSLAEIAASGGKARVDGQKTEKGKASQPVAIEVEILGKQTLDWEDCRYQVVEFRKVVWLKGKKASEGVILYAPDAMISFRSESTEEDTGARYSYALTELQ
ncbi:hypothetical protein MASR1M32_17160 [Rhodobacter sp.]